MAYLSGGISGMNIGSTGGRRGIFNQYSSPTTTQPSVTPRINQVYGNAVNQNTGDYDRIMKLYEGLLSGSSGGSRQSSQPYNFQPTSPTFNNYIKGQDYTENADLSNTIGKLQGIADTGGYSETDRSSLRARALSPIRSVYASAIQNAKRQKLLQGGYSPNAGAIEAKMAREQGDVLSNATTNVNAALAEMIASGKMNALSALGPLTSQREGNYNQWQSRQNDLENQTNAANAAEQRRVDEFNARMGFDVSKYNQGLQTQDYGQDFNTIQSMQSLYGTTPGLSNLFGSQALQNQGQMNNMYNLGANMGWDMYNSPRFN